MRRVALSAEDVLLLLADGAAGPYELDRFRLMKGAFLVSKLGEDDWEHLFNFRAYDYGPFDSSVYRAKDALWARGLLASEQNAQYGSYSLTEQGRERVREIEADIGKDDAEWIRAIGRWLAKTSFSKIVEKVYGQFPDYATRSVLR
jgi:hypothetical protein